MSRFVFATMGSLGDLRERNTWFDLTQAAIEMFLFGVVSIERGQRAGQRSDEHVPQNVDGALVLRARGLRV